MKKRETSAEVMQSHVVPHPFSRVKPTNRTYTGGGSEQTNTRLEYMEQEIWSSIAKSTP